MKIYSTLLILLVHFNVGLNQTSLQYVFASEGHNFFDISIFKNIQIGVGQFDPCSHAYICALSDNNLTKWDKSFNMGSYSFFSDILRVNDSIFYAVGEEWLADDIHSLLSIFFVKMDINGNILLFKKITDPQLLENQNFHINCKIQELPNKDLLISAGKKLVYLSANGSVYNYLSLNKKIIDFKSAGQNEFYYISDSSVHYYDPIKLEVSVLNGLERLRSLELYNNSIYFIAEDNKLFYSDLNGKTTITISDSIACKSVVDYKISNNKLYVIGYDFSGKVQLFIHDVINQSTETISMDDIQRVSYGKLDASENGKLISGYCAYGRPNIFFLTMDHSYELPTISKDLAISNLRQTDYKRDVDTIHGGILIYNHHFSFDYTISNYGNDPVTTFHVYSDDYFAINCFHAYYKYIHAEEMLPGASVTLSGTVDIVYTGSPTAGICLKVAVADNELDKEPSDNLVCKNIVDNEDPENNSPDFQIYPNPANGFIHLSNETPGDYKIYNSYGDVVMELKNNGNTELDVSNFKAGIYFIIDSTFRNRKATKKFIKL